MPALRQLPAKELSKIIKRLGFKETNSKGSHHRFEHADGRKTTIPIHGSEPIGIGLLLKIIKQDLKMTKEEFEKILDC